MDSFKKQLLFGVSRTDSPEHIISEAFRIRKPIHQDSPTKSLQPATKRRSLPFEDQTHLFSQALSPPAIKNSLVSHPQERRRSLYSTSQKRASEQIKNENIRIFKRLVKQKSHYNFPKTRPRGLIPQKGDPNSAKRPHKAGDRRIDLVSTIPTHYHQKIKLLRDTVTVKIDLSS